MIDNFKGHDFDESTLTNINVLFLPPNTTSKTQPLDAGLISVFKVYYRRKLMHWVMDQVFEARRTNAPLEVGGFKKRLSLCMVSQWIKESLEEIQPSFVAKCFKKCLQGVHAFDDNVANVEVNEAVAENFGADAVDEIINGMTSMGIVVDREDVLRLNIQEEEVSRVIDATLLSAPWEEDAMEIDEPDSNESEHVSVPDPAQMLKRAEEFLQYAEAINDDTITNAVQVIFGRMNQICSFQA